MVLSNNVPTVSEIYAPVILRLLFEFCLCQKKKNALTPTMQRKF